MGGRQCRRHEAKRRKWSSHIAEWEASGKSQAGYCREHGLSLRQFYYWKRKHSAKQGSGVVKLVPVGLHPIQIHQARSYGTPLVLHVGRYKVEVGPGFDSATLLMLVRTLDRL